MGLVGAGGLGLAFFRQMHITHKSSKDEVISNACELAYLQEDKSKHSEVSKQNYLYTRRINRIDTHFLIHI